MLQIKKGWFIAAYAFGIMFFVMYLYTNKDVIVDSLGYNLPAGVNSLVFFMANVMSLAAAFFYAEGDNRKRILRSLAIYAFVCTELWTMAPVNRGLFGGYALFVLLGLYHIRLIDEEKLFSEKVFPFIGMDKKEQKDGELTGTQIKYMLWAMISILMFLLGYWNV